MKAAELAGVALYSDDLEEIREALRESFEELAVSSLDAEHEHLLAECAHAIGHIARRFAVLEVEFLPLVLDLEHAGDTPRAVSAAIADMRDDIEQFIPEGERLGP